MSFHYTIRISRITLFVYVYKTHTIPPNKCLFGYWADFDNKGLQWKLFGSVNHGQAKRLHSNFFLSTNNTSKWSIWEGPTLVNALLSPSWIHNHHWTATPFHGLHWVWHIMGPMLSTGIPGPGMEWRITSAFSFSWVRRLADAPGGAGLTEGHRACSAASSQVSSWCQQLAPKLADKWCLMSSLSSRGEDSLLPVNSLDAVA